MNTTTSLSDVRTNFYVMVQINGVTEDRISPNADIVIQPELESENFKQHCNHVMDLSIYEKSAVQI